MKRKLTILLIALSIIICNVPCFAASSQKPVMTVTAFDYGCDSVNSGDAVLVASNGEYLLMDTGNYDKSKKIINTLKKKKIKKLSLYLSHWHEDHFYYLWYILNDSYFTVKHIYLPPASWVVTYGNKSNKGKGWYRWSGRCYEGVGPKGNRISGLYGAHQIVAKAREKRIPTTFLKKGSSFKFGYATARVIWYGCNCSMKDTFFDYGNDRSLVTKISAGGMSYLTAGDIGREVYTKMNKNRINLSADLLKLSHHGSTETASIVKSVHPKCAFYFNSNENKGARNLTKDRSEISKVTDLYSVRYNGDIVFNFYGKGKSCCMSVQAQRNIKNIKTYK